MKSQMKAVYAALAALALIVCVTWGVSRLRGDNPMPWQQDDDARIAALERKQDEQFELLNSKLDRLATGIGGAPAAGARPARTPAASPFRDPQALAQAAQRTAQMRKDLDTRVQNEPVAAKWAMETTRQIENSLTMESLTEIGAQPPEATQIDCRTSICKINMVFADETDAADAALVMNMAMADRLPYTQVFQKQRTDGGVDYVVYASKTRPR